jgi:hypothetical protein
MGTSKRYPHVIDAQMDARVLDGIMRTGKPDTLSELELQLDRMPLTRDPQPKPARAWIRYGEHSVEIDVEVVAWTDRAIAVRWPGPGGDEHRAWVWMGAVSAGTSRQ